MGGEANHDLRAGPDLPDGSGQACTVPGTVNRGMRLGGSYGSCGACTDGTQKEIFVYDRRIIQPTSSASAKSLVPEIPLPPKSNIAKAPDTIADQTDLEAWRTLFQERRSWALKVVEDCAAMSGEALRRYGEIEVIAQATDAAVVNLEKHVKGLDQKNADIQGWAADIQKEQDLNGRDWEASLARLHSLPATTDMITFITGRDVGRSSRKPSLDELVSPEEIKRAVKLVRNISTQLSRNGAELGTKVDEVLRRTDDLFDKFEKTVGRPASVMEPGELMQDIEAIAKKVSSDYENVLGYADTPKNVSQASKSALLHTKTFLPNLSKRSLEMDGLLRSATETRNSIAANSISIMHDIAALTSMLTEVNSRFPLMELNDDAFDAFNLLSTLNNLPVTYASFVAEAIRRREWNDKVRADTSTLANEMAAFQDEEARRRRKWQKSIGSALWGDKSEQKVMALEVNLHGEEEEWPQVTRQHLVDLLEALRAIDAKAETTNDISKMISDLNNPTKQQARRAKAFKAGSIHEAALGRSTLLVRGDDDLIRSLQDEKARTESKLKTAESRVRRLEDLLHRQSSSSRTSMGNFFQVPSATSPDLQNVGNPLASPRLQEDMSRRSSVSSRRFSANQGQEEKGFQQKLLSLEAELIAERERTSGLEKEVSARTSLANAMKAQIEDANSTKKDLMENFEAQQREFIEERKSLDDEIARLKTRLEEVEDDMDRYVGSRENEKTTTDQRVRSLQDELSNVRKVTTADAQKMQGQVDYLRNDARLQHESNETLESQLQIMREENSELKARAEKAEAAVESQWDTLREVHLQLKAGSPVPDEFSTLRDALIRTSGDIVAELKSAKSDAMAARSDHGTTQSSLAERQSELAALKDKLASEEAETARLRETLSSEKAKISLLETDLTEERNQLNTLRNKIATGETRSGDLRTRLGEEERKVTSLSDDLAARLSQIGGLEEEVRSSQDKAQSLRSKLEKLASRFEARTGRTKDLTQRVYAQNDRLCRLLERLSYSVTREGQSMTIQRVPKADRTNANDSSDPGTSMRRSISGAVTRKAMVDSGDLDLLYWMHNDDLEVETEKYDAYLNAIGYFDVEAFCEVITKRVKDVEYTAKKYSKDARAYRDKSHAAQKEAHEKIAFKNFKEGDLALFLPTRNQATGAWAAFNVGAPHYFLREQDSHKLRTRDWLLARIHKIEDRVVDLSKSISGANLNTSDGRSFGEASNGGDSYEDDNPFDLSDGLRWYLIDATEEKPGAPSTPGLGKSTVASAHIDATGSIQRRTKKSSISDINDINKTLSKSLDSRRSSSNSKKAIPASNPLGVTGSTTSLKPVPGGSPAAEGSSAQMIRRENTQETTGSENKPSDPEVRDIDDLLGP
jgi:autophagy-related protein 11